MSNSDPLWEPPLAGTEAEHLVGALDRLRVTFRWKAGQHASLRRLVYDLIEEYGRHTGPGPSPRAIDGRTGEDPPGWRPVQPGNETEWVVLVGPCIGEVIVRGGIGWEGDGQRAAAAQAGTLYRCPAEGNGITTVHSDQLSFA
jgi:hypothetical protein